MMTSRELVEESTRGGTSAWKIQSNRRNAQLSTGPRTPEGKAASSRNAYQHGYRALMPAPDEREPEVEAARTRWIDELAPTSDRALFYADMSFRAKRRLEAISDATDAATAERMRDAGRAFYERRCTEVEDAVNQLFEQPMRFQMRLMSTVMGCEQLGRLLDEVEADFLKGGWNQTLCRKLSALWGKGGFWADHELELATETLPTCRTEEEAAGPMRVISSRIIELRLILQQQIEELDDEEEQARRWAFEIAKCDTSAQGQLYHRYFRDNQRDFFRWTNQAVRLSEQGDDLDEATPRTLIPSCVEHLAETGTVQAPLPSAIKTQPQPQPKTESKQPAPNEAKSNGAGSAGFADLNTSDGVSYVPIVVGSPPRMT